ncbi:hypothetical protein PUNSTDRAFT_121053 [Punctularia strigosozonata HHB-11173 SS5]|uniref:uncharacterized protein n=1 Tax=Punctularia strigosozonata (strain HHB-11173) TaxID=741275 RepID=UPI0004417AF7|nr:uncharacterized protein PUNSTDRAFT_121053 [Punctularia strigosozonata HHB-11173 SS5]EIN07832.1 hypothetical protein PUNSTDRAFT_121053 [Punctularia strigosozonata HHB-11173 SS5]
MFAQKGAKTKARPRSKSAAAKGKKKANIGPSGQTWTPLEEQVLKLKEDNPGTLLMVAVGYKYKFYGEDAKIASKELGIACFPQRNFLVATAPIFRREIYVKKLLAQGYRVGIVDQTETAALKAAGGTRNSLFARGLTNLYTSTTYVDELNSLDDSESGGSAVASGPLMCLVEQLAGGMGKDDRVRIGMICISPSTGDVVWDEFYGEGYVIASTSYLYVHSDTHMRIEVETRLVHTKPSEILLSGSKLSDPSEKTLLQFVRGPTGGTKPRIERFEEPMTYTDAFSYVTEFFSRDDHHPSTSSQTARENRLVEAIADFPHTVIIALARAIKYLSAFDVADVLREINFFTRFAGRAHMLLNGKTMTNLEIYRNETTYAVKGSLLWVLDHTKTKFGSRLLRSWIGRPLMDETILKERTDAIEEILGSTSGGLVMLKDLLKGLPDLAKGLCRIQYGKCTPSELAALLVHFNRVSTTFRPTSDPSEVGFKSSLLNEIIHSLPKLHKPMQQILGSVSMDMLKKARKDQMWIDSDKYPAIADRRAAIDMIEGELADELKRVQKLLKRPSLRWSTWNGEEYLVEIRKDESQLVPPSWNVLNTTKLLRRYRIPLVKQKIQERAQYQEALQAEAEKAYLAFLAEIARDHYAVMREVINKLATADCLLSLAHVASQEGYVKAEFTQEDVLEIEDGRHPIVEALSTNPFVPNTVRLGAGSPRSKVITGPNMGGKSSCVRMTALIALMAQIGSWVPASRVRMRMLDGIFTRMGAADDLARGRSTFMVELSETQHVMQAATDRSLVILDELGRGTSTYDGMAIASAVLHHLLESTSCKTLFITHYPLVARELEKKFPTELENLHMGFIEDTRSFGVECGRLAGVPESVLQVAAKRAEDMRVELDARARLSRFAFFLGEHEHNLTCSRARQGMKLLAECLQLSSGLDTRLPELQDLAKSLDLNDKHI